MRLSYGIGEFKLHFKGNIMIGYSRLLSLIVLACGVAVAVNAQAGPVLPNATISGYIGLGAAADSVSLNAPGTASLPAIVYVWPYGNYSWGTGTLTATLGSNPSVYLTNDQIGNPLGISGGGGQLSMFYSVEYYLPGAPIGATTPVNIYASDFLSQSGAASTASATMNVSGVNGLIYNAAQCLTTAITNGCGGSGGVTSSGASFSTGLATMVDNSVYTVQMLVSTYNSSYYEGTNGVATALINTAGFSAPASGGGTFVFSPGIANPVPEPGTYAMLLAGLGLIGFIAYRRKNDSFDLPMAA